MKKAYWNLIKEDLESTEQRFEHVIKLLIEIRERLKTLTPNNQKLINELDENIDDEFLKQLFSKSYDISNLVLYILSKLETSCAPCDDDELKQFKCEVIDFMKKDNIIYHEFLEYFIPKVHQKIDLIEKRICDYKKSLIRP